MEMEKSANDRSTFSHCGRARTRTVGKSSDYIPLSIRSHSFTNFPSPRDRL